MKPFYRNIVTIGIFLTVMLTIVDTASAQQPNPVITSSGIGNYTIVNPSPTFEEYVGDISFVVSTSFNTSSGPAGGILRDLNQTA